ncbi:helix-turn-helix domain-containing protein [Duganella sp. CY15W]|nr:helix-turn-helix domain-containing protein [Duganella sp. CY15W]
MGQKYDQIRKQLALNIRAMRGRKGLSQEDLAFAAGLDRTYISQVERCVGNPSLKVLCSIAMVLEVDIQELFDAVADSALQALPPA